MNALNAIRASFRNVHPDNQAIVKGMVWVTLFVFLGKLAGAAKEMAVAYRYGICAEVDAYLFVFNIVTWPIGVWFSVLTVVLVPLAARIRHDSLNDLSCFRSELLGLTLLIGSVLALSTWFGLPFLLHSSWTGLPPTSAIIASKMGKALALLAPLGVLISLFSAWMLSAGRHANTLLECVPASVLLVALLVFSSGGSEPLVWGTIVGFLAHLMSLFIPMARTGEVELPRFTHQSPQWPVFWQGFGIMMVGQALMSFVGIIDQFFAAHLDTGAIAMLGYANRILALILSLGATAVSRATLPVFSRARIQGGGDLHLNHVVTHWVLILSIVGLVAMVIGWVLAPWAVKLLFERGAFVAKDTNAVTEVLRYGMAQLPVYFVGILFVSMFTSQSRYGIVSIIGGINLCVKVIANFILVDTMGVKGIMLSTSIMLIVSTMVMITVLYFDRKKARENEDNQLF